MAEETDIQRFQQDVYSRAYFLAASLGVIPGVEVDVKFGHVPDAVAGVRTDLWENGATQPVYIFPSEAGELVEAVSANAGDTGDFTIEGTDGAGLFASETVTLAGLVPVAVPGLWTGVNRAYNTSGTDLLGKVIVRGDGSTSANVFAAVDIDDQQTSQAIYQVPADKIAVIINYSTAVNKSVGVAASAVFTFRIRKPGKVYRTQIRYGLEETGTTNISSDLVIPVFAGPVSRIKISATPSTGPADMSGEFSMLLIDKDLVPPALLAELL